MKIRQRQKLVWVFTCHDCHTVLELDKTDFDTKIVYDNYGNEYAAAYISTPCPVCGRVWDNVARGKCHSELVPVEE